MLRRITASLAKVPARSMMPRTFVSFARPLTRPTMQTNPMLGLSVRQPVPGYVGGPSEGPVSIFDIVKQQRRFKSRGNTYQPSMLKRKRRAGFLARLRTRGGRKILERRKAKGRWFLTY